VRIVFCGSRKTPAEQPVMWMLDHAKENLTENMTDCMDDDVVIAIVIGKEL